MSIADRIMNAPYAYFDVMTASCFVKMFNRGLGKFVAADLQLDANVHDRCDNHTKAQVIRQLANDIYAAS